MNSANSLCSASFLYFKFEFFSEFYWILLKQIIVTQKYMWNKQIRFLEKNPEIRSRDYRGATAIEAISSMMKRPYECRQPHHRTRCHFEFSCSSSGRKPVPSGCPLQVHWFPMMREGFLPCRGYKRLRFRLDFLTHFNFISLTNEPPQILKERHIRLYSSIDLLSEWISRLAMIEIKR